jgi:hypothetical protein
VRCKNKNLKIAVIRLLSGFTHLSDSTCADNGEHFGLLSILPFSQSPGAKSQPNFESMSLIITVTTREGIVMAADSRLTLTFLDTSFNDPNSPNTKHFY